MNLSTVPTKDLVAELASRTRSTEPKAQAIIIAVAQAFDIAITDLLSSTRRPKFSTPRLIAMALCRQATSLSLHQLGNLFNRNHATIVHAAKRFPKISTDPHYAQPVHQLCIQFSITK